MKATVTKPLAKPIRGRLRKMLLRVVCIGLALAGILFASSKSYDWAKRFQAARLAQMAQGYADQGKMQEAMMSADTALRLDPKQPAALRFMAELFEADGRSNQAMELYGRLYLSGAGTLEDLKSQALNALRAGYTEPATYLAKLVAEKGEPDFLLIIEADVRVREGKSDEALTLLRRAVEVYGSRSARLALLRFLLATPNGDDPKIEILEQLVALEDGTDVAALEALAVGLSSDLLAPETRLAWIKKLRQHPIKRPRLLLLADTTEVRIDPSSKARVAAQLAQRVRGAGLQDRLQAAQWLVWQGQPRDTVALLPLKDALTRADAMRTWVDVAAALGEWKTLRDALALPSNPLPTHISKIYTARALKMSNRNAEGDTLYRAALEEFRDKPAEALDILEYLHRSGEYELFEPALPYQLAKPAEAMLTMQRLVPVVAEARDSVRLRRLFQMAQDSETLKNDNTILNDAAYLDLVLGRGVDVPSIQKRFEENLSDPAVRFTLALARLREGKKVPALTLLKQAKIPTQNLAPNQLLILASVLGANMETQKAMSVANLIPATKISNQELELLKSNLLKEK